MLFVVLSVFAVAVDIISISPQNPNQFDSLSCLVGGRIRQGFSYEWIIGDNVFNQNPLPLNGRFAGEEAICNVYVETPFGSRIVGSANVMIEANDAPVIDPPLPDLRIPQGGSDNSIILNDHVSDRHTPDNELRWTVAGNRNVNIQIQANQGNRVVFTPNAGFLGNEQITFTVDDGDGLRTSDTMQVTVFRPNEAPVVDIVEPEPGLTFWVGENIQFSANARDDLGVIRTRWTFGDGQVEDANLPAQQRLVSQTIHSFNAAGQYLVVFAANDAEGAHSEDTVAVNVVEMADLDVEITSPIDGQQFNVGENVQFAFRLNGRQVEIDSVQWSFGDNGRSNLVGPNHAYNVPGNYLIDLVVRDVHGGEGSDQVRVKIVQPQPVNQAPTINRVDTQAVACIAENVQFGVEAEDPENGALNYLWTFGDGQISNVQNPVHAYAAAGRYGITVTVRDNEGAQDSLALNIDVRDCGAVIPPAEVPPVADVGADIFNACLNQPVAFDGSRSNDPDGQVVAFTWDFADGSPLALGAIARHVFANVGQFNVILTVTDNNGNVDDTSVTVFVADCGVIPPVEVPPFGAIDRADRPTLAPSRLAHRFDIMNARSTAQKVGFIPGEVVTLLINTNNFGALNEDLEMEVSVPSLGIYRKERGFTNSAYSASDKAVTFRVPANSQEGWYTARIYIYNQKGDSMVRYWSFYVN